jgi:hypothetical protein
MCMRNSKPQRAVLPMAVWAVCLQGIYTAARRFFLLFQLHTVPERAHLHGCFGKKAYNQVGLVEQASRSHQTPRMAVRLCATPILLASLQSSTCSRSSTHLHSPAATVQPAHRHWYKPACDTGLLHPCGRSTGVLLVC